MEESDGVSSTQTVEGSDTEEGNQNTTTCATERENGDKRTREGSKSGIGRLERMKGVPVLRISQCM
jgi:hypothetical protein